MSKGELEVIEYVPRQAITADVGPPDHPSKHEDLWSRVRFEHRTLTSCAAAVLVAAVHLLLVAPIFWADGVAHKPQQKFRGETALQWVVLLDTSSRKARASLAIASPVLMAIDVKGVLPRIPAIIPPAASPGENNDQDDAPSGLGALYGRYIGQLEARINRGWQRPRSPIGAPIFQCQVQLEQSSEGRLLSTTLLQCNGDARWRLSLMRAIQVASPLPTPPNPALFARNVVLEFRAVAYSSGAQVALYESPAEYAQRLNRVEPNIRSQNALRLLRDMAQAPQSSKTVELRIEGTKVQVKPERQ